MLNTIFPVRLTAKIQNHLEKTQQLMNSPWRVDIQIPSHHQIIKILNISDISSIHEQSQVLGCFLEQPKYT